MTSFGTRHESTLADNECADETVQNAVISNPPIFLLAAILFFNFIAFPGYTELEEVFASRVLSTSAVCSRTSSVFVDKHEIAFPIAGKEPQCCSVEDAFNHIDSGGDIFVHGIAATLTPLLKGLCDYGLKNHKDLGIHTEMFSDGVLDLIQCNAITNSQKAIHPGKLVVSFVSGSTKLYNLLHDSPLTEFGDVQWVNDPAIIHRNPKVTAINYAVEIDLTGQVVSDSVGKCFLSGLGSQVDFICGAAIGDDGLGRSIIALPSISKKGQSKIVPFINEGAGVVTTSSHVHYVVTEFGIAQLWGKNMRQRAYELIKISHLSQREFLEKSAFERLKVMPSSD